MFAGLPLSSRHGTASCVVYSGIRLKHFLRPVTYSVSRVPQNSLFDFPSPQVSISAIPGIIFFYDFFSFASVLAVITGLERLKGRLANIYETLEDSERKLSVFVPGYDINPVLVRKKRERIC